MKGHRGWKANERAGHDMTCNQIKGNLMTGQESKGKKWHGNTERLSNQMTRKEQGLKGKAMTGNHMRGKAMT